MTPAPKRANTQFKKYSCLLYKNRIDTIQAFYWLEVESNKFKDIDSFKQYYDLDIEAAADFYANFSTHVTNNDIWQLSGNNRNYAAVSAWLNKLHDLKCKS